MPMRTRFFLNPTTVIRMAAKFSATVLENLTRRVVGNAGRQRIFLHLGQPLFSSQKRLSNRYWMQAQRLASVRVIAACLKQKFRLTRWNGRRNSTKTRDCGCVFTATSDH